MRRTEQTVESGSMIATARQPAEGSARAWDLPTRLFKWALVLLILGAWISSGLPDPAMTLHKACGYAILALLVYRVLWGLVGGTTARFAAFVRGPAEVWTYLVALRRGRARSYLGHNPAGGLMIVGLLLACAVQVGLGLFASDGVLAAGPFADSVGEETASLLAAFHGDWFYGVILGLSGLHIAANLYYWLVKKDDLVVAMVTGRKRRRAYADAAESKGGSLPVAGLCLLAAVAVVYALVTVPGGSFFASP